LPRQEAPGSHCSECSSALDPWEGQAGPRTYAFSARDVGHALRLVARGESYRSAAAETRVFADRQRDGVMYYAERLRTRYRNLDGQLVANWVDVFTPALMEGKGQAAWPEVLLIDSVVLQANGLPPRSFHVLVAVGLDERHRQRVWLMRPFAKKNQAAWEDFFDLLDGTPQRIVSDMDNAIRGAIGARFPRRGDPAPAHHWSDHHVNQALQRALDPLAAAPDSHPVWAAYERALLNETHWDTFVAAVEHEHQNATSLPAARSWIARYGPPSASRPRCARGRGRIHGAGRGHQQQARHQLIGERADRMGNRHRAIKLLDLLTLGLNNQANERSFAKTVRITLEANAGHAPRQPPHDDPKGHPSLFA